MSAAAGARRSPASRRLAGSVAVVTGAASGIGRATAGLFSDEGARVVAVDIDPGVASALPGAALGIRCDVSDVRQVEQMTQRVLAEFARYDVLINCAGRVVRGGVADCDEASWDAVFAVNAKGVWATCGLALPHMVAQGAGVIVNISSGSGLRPLPGFAAYSASKAAVISLTRSIALEYGDRGIRANCICPGMVDTPMNQAAVALRRSEGEDEATLLAPYAIKRIGRPEEVASAALFLASADSSFVTGATLAVDAGRTLH
ncbi:MAG: SDR family NAD(P)-dependent oxidoreductase [Chloroflexota bacterium]